MFPNILAFDLTHPARLIPLVAAGCAALSLGAFATPARAADSGWTAAYVGTYTQGKSKGIYVSHFDPKTGSLSPLELAAETPNPSFLAVSRNRRHLYAVNEISTYEGKPAGSVSAFTVDPASGKLTLLNAQTSGGPGPCHLSLDTDEKRLFVANYGGGSFEVIPILAGGALDKPSWFLQQHGSGLNPQRQEAPHGHFIAMDPSARGVLACDLGLDKVFMFDIDRAKNVLLPHDPPFAQVLPGAGPRHFAYGRNGRFIYVVNELNSTVAVLKYEKHSGSAELIQSISTLPAGFTGETSCAEIAVHPNGKFVYASNRGHDSLAIFSINTRDGKLTLVGHQPTLGKNPRHFEIHPSGRWIIAANGGSNTLAVFAVDPASGLLSQTGPLVEAPIPVCVQFAHFP